MRRHARSHVVYQRRRHIARRLGIVKKAYPPDLRSWFFKNAGKLSKWNLACSCWLCRSEKYRDRRGREKARWKKECLE